MADHQRADQNGEDTPVEMGSQPARQGQHVRGMRKVLFWGIALTVAGFAALLIAFGAWESDDPSPQADLRTETGALDDGTPTPSTVAPADPGGVGSPVGTQPPPPGGPPDETAPSNG